MTRQSVSDDQYGQLWRRLKEIARRVDEGSISFDATMQNLQLVVEGKSAVSAGPAYPVTVNYDLSLAGMIKAGRYDLVNSDTTERHFPVNGVGTKEVTTELVHFNRDMSSEDVLCELDRCGLRPATIEELLAFGAKYPEIQRQFPIVALGSIWQHFFDRDVPCLWGSSDERGLDFRWFGGGWSDGFRFLAVRK